MGNLGRGIYVDTTVDRVGLRDHGPGLDGVRDQTLLDEALLDHHVGLLERVIHVADFQRPEEGRVGPQVLVNQRRALLDGLLHVHDHVEGLIIHVDVFQGVLRRIAVARDHHRHRVAHVVNLVLGNRPVVGHLEVFRYLPPAGYPDRPLVRQVLAGERRHHTGLLERRRDV